MSDSIEGHNFTNDSQLQKNSEGLKPGWKQIFSRIVLGRRRLVDEGPDNSVRSSVGDNVIEQPIVHKEEVSPAIEHFQVLGRKPLVSLEQMIGISEGSRSKRNIIATLATNNRFGQETESRFVEQGLDGHLIGVGAASIFCMVEGFSDCQSFTGIDVHPSPVAIGRVMVELFREHESFDNFFGFLDDEIQLRERLDRMGLPDGYMDETLESVTFAVDQYQRVQKRYPGVKIEGFHVNEMGLKNLFPLESIKMHYQAFSKLARSGKMNFIQADFFDPSLWKSLGNADPKIRDANNLIFCSNSIDHVFRSQILKWGKLSQNGNSDLAASEQEALGETTALIFKDWKSSKFVFTLTSLKYNLQLQSQPPLYGYDEQEGRPTLIN